MNKNLISQVPVREINGVVYIESLEDIFQNILGAVLGLAGILLFIVLLIGGVQLMTAGGNPQQLESAKKTLTYAIAGLILVALSYMVLVFLRDFTGAPITNFDIFINETINETQ